MDHSLLDILACPACKSDLVYKEHAEVLICRAERLAYPLRQGKPILLVDEARHLTSEELASMVSDA